MQGETEKKHNTIGKYNMQWTGAKEKAGTRKRGMKAKKRRKRRREGRGR